MNFLVGFDVRYRYKDRIKRFGLESYLKYYQDQFINKKKSLTSWFFFWDPGKGWSELTYLFDDTFNSEFKEVFGKKPGLLAKEILKEAKFEDREEQILSILISILHNQDLDLKWVLNELQPLRDSKDPRLISFYFALYWETEISKLQETPSSTNKTIIDHLFIEIDHLDLKNSALLIPAFANHLHWVRRYERTREYDWWKHFEEKCQSYYSKLNTQELADIALKAFNEVPNSYTFYLMEKSKTILSENEFINKSIWNNKLLPFEKSETFHLPQIDKLESVATSIASAYLQLFNNLNTITREIKRTSIKAEETQDIYIGHKLIYYFFILNKIVELSKKKNLKEYIDIYSNNFVNLPYISLTVGEHISHLYATFFSFFSDNKSEQILNSLTKLNHQVKNPEFSVHFLGTSVQDIKLAAKLKKNVFDYFNSHTRDIKTFTRCLELSLAYNLKEVFCDLINHKNNFSSQDYKISYWNELIDYFNSIHLAQIGSWNESYIKMMKLDDSISEVKSRPDYYNNLLAITFSYIRNSSRHESQRIINKIFAKYQLEEKTALSDIEQLLTIEYLSSKNIYSPNRLRSKVESLDEAEFDQIRDYYKLVYNYWCLDTDKKDLTPTIKKIKKDPSMLELIKSDPRLVEIL